MRRLRCANSDRSCVLCLYSGHPLLWSKEKNYVVPLVCVFLFIDCGRVHQVCIELYAFWDISGRVREVLLHRAEIRSIYRRKRVLMSCLGTKTDHVKLDSPWYVFLTKILRNNPPIYAILHGAVSCKAYLAKVILLKLNMMVCGHAGRQSLSEFRANATYERWIKFKMAAVAILNLLPLSSLVTGPFLCNG